MLNAQDNRIDSSSSIRAARAGALFLVLVVMGFAISTQGESAIDASKRSNPVVSAQQDLSSTVYFPAQYVNQGKEVEEFIPTF
jgi:hypothetical protein